MSNDDLLIKKYGILQNGKPMFFEMNALSSVNRSYKTKKHHIVRLNHDYAVLVKQNDSVFEIRSLFDAVDAEFLGELQFDLDGKSHIMRGTVELYDENKISLELKANLGTLLLVVNNKEHYQKSWQTHHILHHMINLKDSTCYVSHEEHIQLGKPKFSSVAKAKAYIKEHLFKMSDAEFDRLMKDINSLCKFYGCHTGIYPVGIDMLKTPFLEWKDAGLEKVRCSVR